MHARTRTLVAAALGTTLLGGCATLDSLMERIRPAPAHAVVVEPATPVEPAAEAEAETAAGEAAAAAVVDDPAADLPIARPGRPLMREIQTALNERGLDAGPADGLSGRRTVKAIRLFKVARRMEVTNDVTPRLLDELGLTRP